MNKNYSNQDFSHQPLTSRDFSHSDLTAIRLTGSNCDNSHFDGANLTEAEFSGASLNNATCSGTKFVRAMLVNATFRKSNLTYADFSGANLSRSIFDESILVGCNFQNTDVTETQFLNCQGLTEDVKRDLRKRGAIVKSFPLGNQESKSWKWLVQSVLVPLVIAAIGSGGIVGLTSMQGPKCLSPKSDNVVQNLKKVNSTNPKKMFENH